MGALYGGGAPAVAAREAAGEGEMAKRTTQLVGGKVTTLTKHQQKSTESAIPWTRGPQTRGQRIARALWG